MTDDLTPAQARRALSDLLDNYDGRKIWGALTGQGEMSLAGPDDRNALAAIGDTLEQAEIRRKTVGDADDADPRGVEETPYGTAMAQKEGMRISWPVEFGVEVVGEPGRREVELTSENRLVDDLDDVAEALARNYPNDRAQDDPREAFISDAASAVASRLGGDLDSADTTGRVGTLRLFRTGNWSFDRDDSGGMPEGAITPETVDETPDDTRQQRSQGRPPGDTEPTTQRPERGQQTLAEAGTTESLSEFASGTVEDDPDRVVGPADEVRRRTATSGAERTQSASEGLGRFARIRGTIRATLHQDEPTKRPDEQGNVEEIPGTRVVSPWIVFGDGPAAQYETRSDLEAAIFQAADVDAMFDAHGEGATLTLGEVVFVDGGDEVQSVEFNDNWIGADVDADTYERNYQL